MQPFSITVFIACLLVGGSPPFLAVSLPEAAPQSAIVTSNTRFAISTANAIPVAVTHSGMIPVIDRLGFVVVACIAGLYVVLHQSASVDGLIVVRRDMVAIRHAWESGMANG